MDIGVSEFASAKGLSRSRVLQLIRKGDVKARRVANQWIIDASQLINYAPKVSRPFSPKMRRAFIDLLSGMEVSSKLDPTEFSRLRKKLVLLREDDDPALLLRSWLINRADRIELNASPKDLERLRLASEVIPSGASNPVSGMSDGGMFEAYVSRNQLSGVLKKFLLVKSDNPNVLLRVAEKPLPRPLPLGYLLADLSESFGPRERTKVKELIKKL